MVSGFCWICKKKKPLTEHHLMGVRDILLIHPEITFEHAKSLLKKGRNSSTKILVCRTCHNYIEQQKKKLSPNEQLDPKKKQKQPKKKKKTKKYKKKIKERYLRRYGSKKL